MLMNDMSPGIYAHQARNVRGMHQRRVPKKRRQVHEIDFLNVDFIFIHSRRVPAIDFEFILTHSRRVHVLDFEFILTHSLRVPVVDSECILIHSRLVHAPNSSLTTINILNITDVTNQQDTEKGTN